MKQKIDIKTWLRLTPEERINFIQVVLSAADGQKGPEAAKRVHHEITYFLKQYEKHSASCNCILCR